VAEIDGQVIAALMLSEVDGIVEALYSGVRTEYLKYSPKKAITHFVRSWAKQRGNRFHHLGGSVGSGDSLIQFKRGFSPLEFPVCTWRVIADPEAYAVLEASWKLGSLEETETSLDFFPIYRATVEPSHISASLAHAR
jgi:lipid II:glycine glycyltransferase (peptidoglycan interpeptide bridge formation enzyme)